MHDYHLNRAQYFSIQIENTNNHVIPFIESSGVNVSSQLNILEIGCGDGGVTKAFLNRGCCVTGVELHKENLNRAIQNLNSDLKANKARLYHADIFDKRFDKLFKNQFELIILKDVIEHINGQDSLILKLRNFLKPAGRIFFGFPPWHMPFGGHQQVCGSKWLSRMPWIHLLPHFIYKKLLIFFKEIPDEYLELKSTGIGISRFENIIKKTGYVISKKEFYLLNPIYKYRFGITACKQMHVIARIPHVRDFLTTCVYYIVEKLPE